VNSFSYFGAKRSATRIGTPRISKLSPSAKIPVGGSFGAKNNLSLLRQTVTLRYSCIEQHADEFSVSMMCRLLKASKAGYYAWRNRTPSQRAQQDQQLTTRIKIIHRKSRETYGSPRIHAQLHHDGIHVSRKRIARLMRKDGVVVRIRRRFRVTTTSKHKHPIAPNLLARRFVPADVTPPGIKTPTRRRVWNPDKKSPCKSRRCPRKDDCTTPGTATAPRSSPTSPPASPTSSQAPRNARKRPREHRPPQTLRKDPSRSSADPRSEYYSIQYVPCPPGSDLAGLGHRPSCVRTSPHGHATRRSDATSSTSHHCARAEKTANHPRRVMPYRPALR
jgi:HTH-like domain